MKQKLGLACTLVRTPRLLLLDEPTVGVDPVSRRELWAIVYRLVNDEGLAVLLSTAYLDEAERCDEVILLHEGRCLGQGSPKHFSEPMRGRSFRVSSSLLAKRSLQSRVSAAAGHHRRHHRGRTGTRRNPRGRRRRILPASLAEIADIQVEAAEPVFEDAFVALLKSEHAVAGPQLSLRRPGQAGHGHGDRGQSRA